MPTETPKLEKHYILKWCSRVTGHCSGGRVLLSKADAEAMVKRMDEAYPDIQHWAEEVKADAE